MLHQDATLAADAADTDPSGGDDVFPGDDAAGLVRDPDFDRITSIAAGIFNAPFALLTIMRDGRQQVQSTNGRIPGEAGQSLTFCERVAAQPGSLVVHETSDDDILRFRTGVTLAAPSGACIGTLCVMDTLPRSGVTGSSLAILHDLAGLAAALFSARSHLPPVGNGAKLVLASDGLLGEMLAASSCETAIEAMLGAFVAWFNAIGSQLWQLSGDEAALRQVSLHGAAAGFPQSPPLDGLLATAIREGAPIGVTTQDGGRFAHDRLLRAAHEHGWHRLLAVPITAGDDMYVILLAFADDGPDFATCVPEIMAACSALQPCIDRKADEERSQLLRSALDMAADGVIITKTNPARNGAYRIVYVNRSFCRTTGYDAAELIGKSPRILLGPGTSRSAIELLSASLGANRPVSVSLLNYRKDGSSFSVEIDMAPITDAAGRSRHFVGVQRDVTTRLQHERERGQLHDLFRMLFEENPLPMWVFDRTTLRFLMVNHAAVAFYGWSKEQFLTMTMHDIRPPEEFKAIDEKVSAAIKLSDRRVWIHKRADGSIVQMGAVTQAYPLAGEHAVLTVVWDMTAMQTARNELKHNLDVSRQLTERLRVKTEELTEASRMAELGTWWLSHDRQEMTWSDEIYTLLGRQRREFPPSFVNSIRVVHPDDRKLYARSTPVAGSADGSRQVEARILRPDGELRHVRIQFRPARRGAKRQSVFGYVQDTSQRWETQQALLRSEKLAVLGHLAGGVAHDFNNLLAVVCLNLEEVIAALPEADELQAILSTALQAAERGADLTGYLLSYTRQAPLRPRAINLASFFRTVGPLARRVLGQDYDLHVMLEPEDSTPLADPSQLQIAVLNIVRNARDAMPGGGEVLISAGSVTLPSPAFPLDEVVPGRYTMITVTDRGRGISPEILPHIFEPFYTTKKMRAGSGLGLSMVDGFIGQSGGRTLVRSVMGEGTSISLFLPLTVMADAEKVGSGAADRPRALLVEDQPAVLATVSRMFTQLGYEVSGVESAAAALAELDRGQNFAVMFADIVLPGDMDGIALASAVAQRAPCIQILLTSGFSEYNRSQKDLPGAGILMKPYKRQELLDRLNKMNTRPALLTEHTP